MSEVEEKAAAFDRLIHDLAMRLPIELCVKKLMGLPLAAALENFVIMPAAEWEKADPESVERAADETWLDALGQFKLNVVFDSGETREETISHIVSLYVRKFEELREQLEGMTIGRDALTLDVKNVTAALQRATGGMPNGDPITADNAVQSVELMASRLSEVGVQVRMLSIALQVLLKSRHCLTPDGKAESPEEISAQFDVVLNDARKIASALS